MLSLAVLPLAVLLTRNKPGAGAPGSSAGLPCIPLHEARMLAPGCTRTMHLYDSSCLAAFKAAMAADGAFALVALDTFSAATRSFSLRSLACAVQILNVRPGEKASKFGDSSLSYYVDIIGTRRIDTKGVPITQMEPYVALGGEIPDFDAATDDHDAVAARCAEIAELTPTIGELQLALLPEDKIDGALRDMSIDACVRKVLEIDAEGGAASDERRRLTLEALASTRYLPPSTRWDALQHRELLPLVETVAAALDSELKRLRAMQSLKSM